MLVELRCVATHVFICRFYKGKQIFDFLYAYQDDEALQKGVGEKVLCE